uniref:RxLR effector candidate protein n=1 Tax=Hyaloperonospora arabidopsidis (strain Emoy2) TaxID=559515 RepID=M4C185_HYAAE
MKWLCITTNCKLLFCLESPSLAIRVASHLPSELERGVDALASEATNASLGEPTRQKSGMNGYRRRRRKQMVSVAVFQVNFSGRVSRRRRRHRIDTTVESHKAFASLSAVVTVLTFKATLI